MGKIETYWEEEEYGYALNNLEHEVKQTQEKVKKEKKSDDKKWETEKKEKSESWTKFFRQSWVWYSINGWKLIWANTFSWNWKLFKWTRWETSVKWSMHLDNPLDTKWQWKLILWTQLYKGFTFDGDYTFTWKWNNVLRFGMGYWWKLWDWKYWVRLFPLNTNWSEIYAKVSFSTKVWKNWALSSFVSVDFDTKWYYSETEYTHKLPRLAEWIAAYLHLRLKWTADGSFNDKDSQNIMWWIKFTL